MGRWYAWQGSNLRPLVPETNALVQLSYRRTFSTISPRRLSQVRARCPYGITLRNLREGKGEFPPPVSMPAAPKWPIRKKKSLFLRFLVGDRLYFAFLYM